MAQIRITQPQLMAFKPCDPDTISAYFEGRDYLTVQTALEIGLSVSDVLREAAKLRLFDAIIEFANGCARAGARAAAAASARVASYEAAYIAAACARDTAVTYAVAGAADAAAEASTNVAHAVNAAAVAAAHAVDTARARDTVAYARAVATACADAARTTALIVYADDTDELDRQHQHLTALFG